MFFRVIGLLITVAPGFHIMFLVLFSTDVHVVVTHLVSSHVFMLFSHFLISMAFHTIFLIFSSILVISPVQSKLMV